MKTWALVACLLAAAVVPHHASAETDVSGIIRIATLANDPPFEYGSSTGDPKGMEIELGDKYCALAKLDCQWVTLPFTQLIPALLAHKVDAVLAQLSVTAARAKAVSFTDPVTYNSVVILGPKGSSITDNPASMRGRTIGVGAESVEAAWAEAHLEGIATIKLYDDGAKQLQDLQAHEIDATIVDQPAAYDFLRRGGKFDFAYLGAPLTDPMLLGAGNTAIAVRKDDTTLLKSFDTAIDAVREDGTFQKISAMYFPFSMKPK
jgi:ABC-type amino acid transport substrate-binding protein